MASAPPHSLSKLSDQLNQAGLEAEYWAGILKTKLSITLPQQIQYLNESHLEVLKGSIRHEWEENALRAFLGVKTEPSSNQAAKDAESEIASKLTEAGLDGGYWANILKTKLGITRMEQTVNIQTENLNTLNDVVRYDWEEKALRKFFGISEDVYEASMLKNQQQHKQRLEEARNILEHVVELKQKGVHQTDDMISSKLDQLRQLMNVAKEEWIQQYDDKSLDDILGKLNSDFQGLGKLAEGRPVNSASEILENASAGLALRGILVGEVFRDDCEKRIVLDTPTNIKLMNPSMLQFDEVIHFSSKTQSDSFHRSLDTMGYNLAATAKGGGLGLQAETGFSQNYQKEDENHVESHKQTKFESRVKLSVVPTAACELNPYNLKLSQQSLQELKNIEKVLIGSEDLQLLNRRCEDFLKTYGSHINAGVLHFGGVNKFVATYTSETKSSSDITKSMLRDVLSAYTSASYSGFGISAAGSLNADNIKTHGSFTGDYENSELAKTYLYTTSNGGPQEVNALSLWKMGLVTYNCTWALIDRGKTLSRDFVGIWKLIPNHKGEFKKPDELASYLMKVWERMSGYVGSSDQEQTIIKAVDEMIQVVDKITTWNSNPMQPEKCIEYLQEVLTSVEQVQTQTGTTKYWEETLCTNIDVSSFLEKVVELKDTFSAKDVCMIQFLIRKLVNPTGIRKFPGKVKVMKWANVNTETVDFPTILGNTDFKSIPDLIRDLEENFIPKLQIEHSKNFEGSMAVSDRINSGATVDFALSVARLLKHLQSSRKIHEVFVLKVSLLPLHYHWPTMRFKALVTLEKMQEFVQCLEKSWKEFLLHKEKGIIQLEAFLVHASLIHDHFNKENKESELEFSELTKDLRQVISPKLNNVLNKCILHSPFDWFEMKRVTGELAKGNMSVGEEREVDIDVLVQVLKPKCRMAQKKEQPKEHKSEITARGAFLDILKTLGLEAYYPSKISLLDAMVIKMPPEHPKLQDLPWMIIRKLLMIDFHARDYLLSVVKQSEDEEIGDDGSDFILDDFFPESHASSGGEDTTTTLNVLDVLVAIFTCSDNFLKQTLAQKLFVCKLAIPFLYPLGSGGDILMSLWALRTITVQWRSKNKETTEVPVTDNPLPLVTFLRLGRPPLSKSKLMNDIIRDESHDTFFNHDCNNGTIERRLTDGLVECCWFITTGRDKEHLPGTTMLLNLRGDASSLEKQMQILQEISSVLFVIVTAKDLARNPSTSTFHQILNTGAKVILFLISGNSNQSIQELRMEQKACVEAVGKDSLKEVRIIPSTSRQGIQINASELKTKARRHLSEAIAEVPDGILLEKCAQIAEKWGIIVDEKYDEACIKGKVLAEQVVNRMRNKNIAECKRDLLPLQGTEWMEYCKLLKKQHRASGKDSQMSSTFHAEQMKQKMDRLREKQVDICCKSLNPFIKDFMSVLQNKTNNQDVVVYFLNWIKILLDEISRANLPGLRRQYHALWNQFQEAKKKKEESKMQQLKKDVDDAEIRLASASLGLENLFRELGQIYEAVIGSIKIREDTKKAVEYLPDIAAELLMMGNPLELIDGDASSVPISWVTAVLSKLRDIIGEKRLFVLSVLGIQSSGKSTFLNTMFGLQFAVSAGRCTRGAYMQLIRVGDDSKLPFDYIIVVDTEGIRAPELGQLKYEHDNELATLVIGLGDVTLINIKGENTAEMKDILQIAVHAFLRMNLVSKNIKDHRSCIFVHQNVPAANAEELMMHGCRKLQESLDDMAKEAALSENIENIHSFSQIINFDVQKHVWYFSDLWLGNPPMAPANPGYSEKVDLVRRTLLKDVAQEQTTFLTTSDFSVRIADLWNGVLNDDFVFSFRNSLEVKAYNNLQSTYYTLEWELQNELKTWLQKAEIKLKMCEGIDELEDCFQYLISNQYQVLTSKAEDIKISLEDYFEKNNLKEIIIQWQQSKLNQLTFAVEQLQNEGKSDLLSVKEARRIELFQIEKLSNHEARIMSKAVELADELKGKEVTDDEMERKFNDMWVTMAHELTVTSADKDVKIDLLMEEILLHTFYAHKQILRRELVHHPLVLPLEQTSLEGSISLKDVAEDDISLKRNIWKRIFGQPYKQGEFQAKCKTVSLTSSILQEISTYLKDLSIRDIKFQKAYAKEVIQKLWEKFQSQNVNQSDDCTFTILPKYIVKVAVHVSRHCVQVFNLMQALYNRRHGVKAKLEDYKKTAWSLFKNMVKQSTEEVLAGDLLCTAVKGIVAEEVRKESKRKCVEEVIRDFQMTKYYLIVKIMDDLAFKGNFREYMFYIKKPKEFALKWMTEYINLKMFSTRNGSGISRYAEISKSHVGRIIRCIAKSVEDATNEVNEQKVPMLAQWISRFCQQASEEIAVPVSTLKHLSVRQVVDFSNLQRIILDQLDDNVEASIVEAFVNVTEYSIDWHGVEPAEQILNKIWGCPEQCPFCMEVCADTTADHYAQSKKSHMCVQHRPDGIGGVQWGGDCVVDGDSVSKGQLSHHTCQHSVQLKNFHFNCRTCKFKCRENGKCTTTGDDYDNHNYLDYNTFLPSWDIAPDSTNSVSKYWMWFMATYQSQLRDAYNAKLINVPESWNSITRKEALADLRKVHN